MTKQNPNKMQVVFVPIEKLKSAEYNPRKAGEKEIKELKESLVRFGFVEPIVVNKAKNRENVIIGGHFRVRVAKDIGIKEIPVVYVDIPDIKKEQELNLRLNKNLGQWDFDMLANFDEEMLKIVGWDSEELDKIFQLSLGDENKVPELPLEAKSKNGEIYQLGEHRLMCGDSTKKENIEKLMNGKKVDMVFTDPPYNIGYDYWDFLDKKEVKEYKEWCENWFNNLTEMSPLIILTIGHWNMKMWFSIAKPLGVAIWIARNKTSGSKIAMFNVWEPILIYGKKTKRRGKSDVFEGSEIKDSISVVNDVNEAIEFIKGNNDIFEINNIRQKNIGSHKCPKQVSLMKEILSRYSNRESNILDIFGGSGSTLIACEQLNRICYIMELEPKYCDVIINRWEKFTNKKAIKL